MSRGKYAFWCPVALIRPSRSACSNSQIRYPYGLITMLPRTGPRSTSSARNTTSLYQAEKSSLCGVTLRSSRAMTSRLPSRRRSVSDRVASVRRVRVSDVRPGSPSGQEREPGLPPGGDGRYSLSTALSRKVATAPFARSGALGLVLHWPFFGPDLYLGPYPAK